MENTECSGFPNRKGGQCPLTTNPAQTQTKKKVLEVAGETRVFLIFLMLLTPPMKQQKPSRSRDCPRCKMDMLA